MTNTMNISSRMPALATTFRTSAGDDTLGFSVAKDVYMFDRTSLTTLAMASLTYAFPLKHLHSIAANIWSLCKYIVGSQKVKKKRERKTYPQDCSRSLCPRLRSNSSAASSEVLTSITRPCFGRGEPCFDSSLVLAMCTRLRSSLAFDLLSPAAR
jgi:hypothetical protein